MKAKEGLSSLEQRIHQARQEAGLVQDKAAPESAAARHAGSGVEFGLTILLMALGGAGLDKWLQTKPWFMLLGLVLGLVVGMWNLYRASLQLDPLDIGVKRKKK